MIEIVNYQNKYKRELFNIHSSVLPINDQMSEKSFFDEFSQNTRQYFVAIDSQTKSVPIVVGYIGLFDCDSDFNIIGIAVKREYQHKGVGRMLLNKAVEYANVHNKISLSLEVDEKNCNAVNFYKNFGFEEVSRRHNYYKTSDAIIMFYYLNVDYIQ